MKQKIKEVEVELYGIIPVIKLTKINCARWGIEQPKPGQKIKIIYDW